jgi:hypothetical protein
MSDEIDISSVCRVAKARQETEIFLGSREAGKGKQGGEEAPEGARGSSDFRE